MAMEIRPLPENIKSMGDITESHPERPQAPNPPPDRKLHEEGINTKWASWFVIGYVFGAVMMYFFMTTTLA